MKGCTLRLNVIRVRPLGVEKPRKHKKKSFLTCIKIRYLQRAMALLLAMLILNWHYKNFLTFLILKNASKEPV